MDLMQAKRELYSTSFFFPRTRQRRAVKYLADSADVASVDVLAEALVKGHQESPTIRDILTGLGRRDEQPKIDRLWQLWLDGRSDTLANVLREMGRPARDPKLRLQSHWKLGRAEPVDPNPTAVRGALSWLNDADAQIRENKPFVPFPAYRTTR